MRGRVVVNFGEAIQCWRFQFLPFRDDNILQPLVSCFCLVATLIFSSSVEFAGRLVFPTGLLQTL